MAHTINPNDTTRATAYALWMQAPNPMVTFFKTLDVTSLVKLSRQRGLKFNMLLDYCIGRAAVSIPEFFLLPVGDALMQYDSIAVNTIVLNRTGQVSSCDLPYSDTLEQFNRDYLTYTTQTAETCQDHDLSEESMVIGTSAIVDTELDGRCWDEQRHLPQPLPHLGKYRKRWFRYELPISFQFHHTQMDGAHAGRFLRNLQQEIDQLH